MREIEEIVTSKLGTKAREQIGNEWMVGPE